MTTGYTSSEAFGRWGPKAVKERAPGRRHPRRRKSAEAPPVEAPAEILHAPKRAQLLRDSAPDFIGCAASPRRMRPVSVVPLHKVGAARFDFGDADEEPRQRARRL